MSLHVEYMNQHRMNRVLKVATESNLPLDTFVVDVISKSLTECKTNSLSELLAIMEKNSTSMNEAWWNPFSWFKKKKSAAKSSSAPATPREEPVYDLPSYTKGGTSYIGRTPQEARGLYGQVKGKELAGGEAAEKAVKDTIKSFLIGKDGTAEDLVAKLNISDASPNRVAMVKHLAKALVKFLDNFEFKYNVISDPAFKEKFRLEHEALMSKMESRQLSAALGFAGDVVADFDKFTGPQQSNLYNKISAMAEGKFKSEDTSRIQMAGYSPESVTRIAKKALAAIEAKKGMGGMTADKGETQATTTPEEDMGPTPVDLSGKKSKNPKGEAEKALKKQKLGSMGSLEDYFRYFRFKKGGVMQQVENEAELFDAIKNKKLNKIAVLAQLRSAAENSPAKLASDLTRVADAVAKL